MMMIHAQIREHLKDRNWKEAEVTPAVIRYFEVVWRQNEALHDFYESAQERVNWANNLRSI